MERILLLFVLLISVKAMADSCDDLKNSGDGVPAEYYIQECKGNNAFKNKNYMEAAKYFSKASSVNIFEAPNYELRLDWGLSLCLAGQTNEGKELIDSFELMAKADLGYFYFECPDDDDIEQVLGVEHMELACIGTVSALSQEGINVLNKKRLKVTDYLNICNRLTSQSTGTK